jgi:hypothetical protein
LHGKLLAMDASVKSRIHKAACRDVLLTAGSSSSEGLVTKMLPLDASSICPDPEKPFPLTTAYLIAWIQRASARNAAEGDVADKVEEDILVFIRRVNRH